MTTIKLSVGQKKYFLQSKESNVGKIKELAAELDQIIQRNSVRYKDLSPDNLMLVTALEMLIKNKTIEQQQEKKISQSCEQMESRMQKTLIEINSIKEKIKNLGSLQKKTS